MGWYLNYFSKDWDHCPFNGSNLIFRTRIVTIIISWEQSLPFSGDQTNIPYSKQVLLSARPWQTRTSQTLPSAGSVKASNSRGELKLTFSEVGEEEDLLGRTVKLLDDLTVALRLHLRPDGRVEVLAEELTRRRERCVSIYIYIRILQVITVESNCLRGYS